MNIDVYTDGSCLGNPGSGGYAYIFVVDGEEIASGSGGIGYTTNNQMELTAVLEALYILEKLQSPDCTYTIHTDSSYVVNAFKERWIDKWQHNNWKTSTGSSVKNKNLWVELLALTRILNPNFVHVTGHSGNKFNEKCDRMAVSSAQKFQR